MLQQINELETMDNLSTAYDKLLQFESVLAGLYGLKTTTLQKVEELKKALQSEYMNLADQELKKTTA